MEKEQELEWLEAQNIVVSEDLVAVAKKQLQFLAIVDKHRCLYEGPTLQKAIFRYNACWLPLLAKHSESQIFKGPLVVPLDCEWIWHCHRLNPVRYKTDCEELYGRILDNYNVVSSVQGTATSETEEIWNTLYPKEPYLLDLTRDFSKDTSEQISECEKHTKYDLVSAVKRQSPFCYQVSRPHMNNQLFLEGAVARYKGFLYLIKKNRERSIRRFCVPTYDIDLIWHSHQLHPVSYCKDLRKLVGKVLEHDDMDSDRTKGKKLDVGFSETTEQWEETFGSRYWRAGAMYRGSAPSPLTTTPYSPNITTKKVVAPYDCQKMIQLPEVKVVEVLLEIVGVKNLPVGHKGSLFVSFTKAQPDTFFNAKRRLTIFSESGEKQVASFQCEPTGELQFQLISHSPSNLPNLPILWSSKKMGSTSISLQEFLAPISSLSVEKWLELVPSSGNVSSKPICLRIAISFTVPALAPRIFHTVCSRPFLRSSCFFPLPGRIHHAKRWTRVIDETGSEVISLQMRDSKKATARDTSVSRREVIGVTKSLETITLAEFVGTGWSLLDYNWCLKLEKKSGKDGHLFELVGNRMVKIYPGRKLEFEPKHCERGKSDHDFLTAVEFSAEVPYGRAVALLDLKSGFLKVNEEWLVLPGIILVFVLSDILRKEGSGGFTFSENLKEMENLTGCHEEEKPNLSTTMGTEVELKMEVAERNAVMPEEGRSHSGGCGSDCGGGCGNMSKSGGCGGCGGCSGCGNMVKSGGCGGCGSGCGGCGGGGCGSRVKSGGCGGCGGGGCGGCGGGGCGSRVKSGGCGGCGGGGSGIRLETGDSAGESAYEASAGNPCIDEHLRKAPTHMNATVVA